MTSLPRPDRASLHDAATPSLHCASEDPGSVRVLVWPPSLAKSKHDSGGGEEASALASGFGDPASWPWYAPFALALQATLAHPGYWLRQNAAVTALGFLPLVGGFAQVFGQAATVATTASLATGSREPSLAAAAEAWRNRAGRLAATYLALGAVLLCGVAVAIPLWKLGQWSDSAYWFLWVPLVLQGLAWLVTLPLAFAVQETFFGERCGPAALVSSVRLARTDPGAVVGTGLLGAVPAALSMAGYFLLVPRLGVNFVYAFLGVSLVAGLLLRHVMETAWTLQYLRLSSREAPAS